VTCRVDFPYKEDVGGSIPSSPTAGFTLRTLSNNTFGRVLSYVRAAQERQESAVTHVYRAYAKDGRLLYVGCTDTFERRVMQHASQGSLWIHMAESFSIEYYPTRKAALAAEAEAIRSEWPLYNIDHSIDPETPRLLIWRRSQEQMARIREIFTNPPKKQTPEEFEASFQKSWAEHCRLRNAVRQAEMGGSSNFYHYGQH
jgi:predicted GIY-YIG superfamily endonuclease